MKTAFQVMAFCCLFAYSAAAQNLYQVTFPNDTTVQGCGTAVDTAYPVIVQIGNCNFNVGVSVTDQVFNTGSGGACAMIYRKYHVVYWCTHSPNNTPTLVPNPINSTIGATAFGTVANKGDLIYTQIIKRTDSAGPVFLACPTGPITVCDYTTNDPLQWNSNHIDNCEGPVKLETAITDACSGSNLTLSYKLFLDTDNNGSMETVINSGNLGAYPIITQVVADTLRGRIDFSPNIQLPYGRHKIQWTAKDNCGHQTICQYEFIVKDCAAPTVICLHGISVNLMPGGMITIPEADLLQYTYDNCTPTPQIKTGIRIAGTGTGFPLNQHEVMLTCAHLGTTNIQVWGQDQFGNADYCTATVQVQDHIGTCPPGNKSGTLLTVTGQAAQGVALRLQLNADSRDAVTDPLGQFTFQNVPPCGGQLLAPMSDPINEVDVADALALARHLLGLEAITDPYCLLAADANHSRQITASDLTILHQHILKAQIMGNAVQLVPQSFQPLAQPLQSFLPAPGQLVPCNFATPIDVKAFANGDVNGTWSQQQGQKMNIIESAPLQIQDAYLEPGTTIEVPIFTPDLDAIVGLQYKLDYLTDALTLTGNISDMIAPDQVHTATAGAVHALWYDPNMQPMPSAGKGARPEAMRLQFEVKKAGKLSDYIQLAAAYSKAVHIDNQSLALEIDWIPAQLKLPTKGSLSLWPNPTSGAVSCTVMGVKADMMTLEITDAHGRQHYKNSVQHAGVNLEIALPTLPRGRYFVRCTGADGVLTSVLVVE